LRDKAFAIGPQTVHNGLAEHPQRNRKM